MVGGHDVDEFLGVEPVDQVVEPTRSANNIVICRRSPNGGACAAGGAWVAPQEGQKWAAAGSGRRSSGSNRSMHRHPLGEE